MDVVALIALAALVGVGVGILSGLLGIGGGVLLIPVFRLGFAMSSHMCTATSLLAVLLTSCSGSISHLRNKTSLPALSLTLGIGGALTSPLGVYLASISPEWLIMLIAAAIILYSAYTMLKKAKAPKKVPKGEAKAVTGEAGEPADPAHPAESADAATSAEPANPAAPAAPAVLGMTKRTIAIGAVIGAIAGLGSGYIGVGGGFVMIPLMISLLAVPMKLASGTSLLAIGILAIPGLTYQAMLGNIEWIAGLSVAIGSIPGAFVGARLVPKVNERALRRLFAAILGVAAVSLILNEFIFAA